MIKENSDIVLSFGLPWTLSWQKTATRKTQFFQILRGKLLNCLWLFLTYSDFRQCLKRLNSSKATKAVDFPETNASLHLDAAFSASAQILGFSAVLTFLLDRNKRAAHLSICYCKVTEYCSCSIDLIDGCSGEAHKIAKI